MAPTLAQQLPAQYNDYYEPFVGGGGLFFALESTIKTAYLSDTNFDLITAYKVIATQPNELIHLLKEHKSKHEGAYYYHIREAHNFVDSVFDYPVEIAARFIYLNKTCFNGLYRVNKSGEFNAAMGRYKNPIICDEENILAVSEALKKAKITLQSFERIEPRSGDFVYCDPPYDSTFTGCSESGFGQSDQERLRDKK